MVKVIDHADNETDIYYPPCTNSAANRTDDCEKAKLTSDIRSIKFYFSGDKNRDLVSLVIQAMHAWKHSLAFSNNGRGRYNRIFTTGDKANL